MRFRVPQRSRPSRPRVSRSCGHVPAMAVLGHEALKEFLGRSAVAKSDRHFAALHDGRIPADWPLRAFASAPGMTTADGAEHRRLRSLVTAALAPNRIEALRPAVAAMSAGLLDELEVAAREGDGTSRPPGRTPWRRPCAGTAPSATSLSATPPATSCWEEHVSSRPSRFRAGQRTVSGTTSRVGIVRAPGGVRVRQRPRPRSAPVSGRRGRRRRSDSGRRDGRRCRRRGPQPPRRRARPGCPALR
jgi:hypothetical protein